MYDDLFIRSLNNPILKPEEPETIKKIYNPGALFENNIFHLFPRIFYTENSKWLTGIAHYTSRDGENFKCLDPLLLLPKNQLEIKGQEDPRITKIADMYYMTYTAYDGNTARYCLATSNNLKKWKKHGPIFKNWNLYSAGGHFIRWKDGKAIKVDQNDWTKGWLKAGGIFNEKINKKYWMIFGEFCLWIAYSENGLNWHYIKKPFLKPRPGYFDSEMIEMGPPPIKTKKGWLVLYNGVDHTITYRLGYLLLDLLDPSKILYRSEQPIFEPKKSYELSGIVDILPGGFSVMEKMSEQELNDFIKKAEEKGIMPKVTFCCGAVMVDEIIRIYYGASDSVICTATAKLDDILNI